METYNLPPVYKGDTVISKAYELKKKVNGSSSFEPWNITGAVIQIVFKQNDDRGRVVKNMTVGNGITITEATEGKFTRAAFIADFEKGKYFHKLVITLDGITKTYYTGQLIVT